MTILYWAIVIVLVVAYLGIGVFAMGAALVDQALGTVRQEPLWMPFVIGAFWPFYVRRLLSLSR